MNIILQFISNFLEKAWKEKTKMLTWNVRAKKLAWNEEGMADDVLYVESWGAIHFF